MLVRLATLLVLFATPSIGGEVKLWLSGDEFDGGPTFSASIDGKEIGSGTVDVAKAGEGGEAFTFTVPDDDLQAAKNLTVQLTNDKYEAGVGDRNLRIVKAQIGDQTIAGTDFAFFDGGGQLVGYITDMLPSNEQTAVLSQAEGRWAAATMAPEPAVAETPAAAPAAPAAPAAEAPAQETPPAPETAAAPEAPEPEAPASETAAAAPADCTEVVTILGYKNRGMDLAPEQAAALAPIIERVRSGACGVVITGYSSSTGSDRTNRQIAEARAKVVLDYLVQQGAVFASEQLVGAGETTEFGPAQADNRRVVVQLVN